MQTKNMKKQNNPDMIFETPFLSKEKTHWSNANLHFTSIIIHYKTEIKNICYEIYLLLTDILSMWQERLKEINHEKLKDAKGVMRNRKTKTDR